jgi:hypothetical protein
MTVPFGRHRLSGQPLSPTRAAEPSEDREIFDSDDDDDDDGDLPHPKADLRLSPSK